MVDGDRSARRIVVMLVAGVLLLAGCGGGGSDDQPAGPAETTGDLVVGGAVDEDALAARRDAFVALDEDAQQQEANEVSGRLERELYAVSGLAEALGSDEAVETSIAETAHWAAGLAEGVADEVRAPARPAPGVPAAVLPEATTFGEGLFGGLLVAMLTADAAVGRTNDGTVGNDSGPGMTIKATRESVELEMKASFTDSTGVTTDLVVRITEAPCPLPDGSFTAQGHVEVASTTGGGRTGKRATFDVSIAGTVGERAELVGYDTEYRGQLADFKASRGGYVELSGAWPREGAGTLAVTRTGGSATDALVEDASSLSTLVTLLVADKLADAAKKGWESGRCVALEPQVSAGPGGLAPGATVTITAAPRSKMDGGKAGGTVTAELTAGEAGVSPDSAAADATFTYVAPGERDKTGTVALEARSRRGVAKATIDFDTKQVSYTASGQDEVTFSGTVASITAPFTVDGTFPGGRAAFRFDGAGEDGGKLRISGGGSGAKLIGSGTYTVAKGDNGVLFLNVRARACVDVSGICRSTTHRITLTPQR